MKVTIDVGTSQQSAMLNASTAPSTPTQLTPVSVLVPGGTTSIELDVANVSGAPYGDVVWVDPFIEDANAPSPSPRPTVTQ